MSWNVNGLRSVHQKGFLDWLKSEKPDVLCLQEIKAHADQLPEECRSIKGYESHYFPAQKPGYSGVALLTKKSPERVQLGIGIEEFDNEGRILIADYKSFVLINAYFPNSQREHTRLPYKLAFCNAMEKFCKKMRDQKREIIMCGDFNIAHQELDLANPKSNENNAGYLPEERAWISKFLKLGYHDVFRELEPDKGHYTWWSYRPGVRERNIGWRLDYHLTSPGIRKKVLDSFHQPKTKGSDHCPVGLILK